MVAEKDAWEHERCMKHAMVVDDVDECEDDENNFGCSCGQHVHGKRHGTHRG